MVKKDNVNKSFLEALNTVSPKTAKKELEALLYALTKPEQVVKLPKKLQYAK